MGKMRRKALATGESIEVIFAKMKQEALDK